MAAQNMPTAAGLRSFAQRQVSAWYTALVTQLRLDPTMFQVAQGVPVLDGSSQDLWNYFDTVPPASINAYYNPSGYNILSVDYGGIINNLVPTANSPDAVAEALSVWINSAGSDGVKPYTADYASVASQLEKSASVTVRFDPNAPSGVVNGLLRGIADINISDDELLQASTLLPAASAVVDITYDHLTIIPAEPVAIPQLSQISGGWFSAAALRYAYENVDDAAWYPRSPSWNDSFGANGNMQRRCAALIVVDGGHVTTAQPINQKSGTAQSGSAPRVMMAAPEIQSNTSLAVSALLPYFPARRAPSRSLEMSISANAPQPIPQPYVLGAYVAPITTLFS